MVVALTEPGRRPGRAPAVIPRLAASPKTNSVARRGAFVEPGASEGAGVGASVGSGVGTAAWGGAATDAERRDRRDRTRRRRRDRGHDEDGDQGDGGGDPAEVTHATETAGGPAA